MQVAKMPGGSCRLITYEFVEAQVDQIDDSQQRFCLTFPLDLQRILRSVTQVGVLEPLILRRAESRYQIVCGFRRFLACKALNRTAFPALVCRDPLSDRQAFDLALWHNVSARRLNDVEISRILRKLQKDLGVPQEEIIRTYLPILGLEPHETIRRRYAGLANLSEGLHLLIAEKNLPIQVSSLFLRFSAEDQEALLNFLHMVPSGVNRIKEMLPYLLEIREREGISVAEFLREPELARCLDEKSGPAPQRSEKAREYIVRRRFPQLSRLKEEVNQKIRALDLPPPVSLVFPPGGEGGKLRASIEFPSKKELEQEIAVLQKLLVSSELDDLLGVLSRGSP